MNTPDDPAFFKGSRIADADAKLADKDAQKAVYLVTIQDVSQPAKKQIRKFLSGKTDVQPSVLDFKGYEITNIKIDLDQFINWSEVKNHVKKNNSNLTELNLIVPLHNIINIVNISFQNKK